MASKCWFVLRQTHYPPPVIPKHGSGNVRGSGPICLGHLIPDLQHLDNVINRHGPLDIPPDMPIYPTKAHDLTFEINKSPGVELSANAGVPIAAAVGVTIKLGAGLAFKQTIKNYWEFESLDTFIFQPTTAYIEDSVEDDEVTAYLERLGPFGKSKMFMMTGIIIARGAKAKDSTVQSRGVHGGPGIDLPAIASAGFDLNVSNDKEVSSSAQKTTEFVWAVRLAKISKGVIDRRWSHETLAKGATFDLESNVDEGLQILNALKDEGVEALEKVPIGVEDDVFIIS